MHPDRALWGPLQMSLYSRNVSGGCPGLAISSGAVPCCYSVVVVHRCMLHAQHKRTARLFMALFCAWVGRAGQCHALGVVSGFGPSYRGSFPFSPECCLAYVWLPYTHMAG
jgi:hypothetical protein